MRDEFLSEEDLDLRNLSESELLAYWDLWLHQAQATNALDAHQYSHGVFISVAPASPAADPLGSISRRDRVRRTEPPRTGEPHGA